MPSAPALPLLPRDRRGALRVAAGGAARLCSRHDHRRAGGPDRRRAHFERRGRRAAADLRAAARAGRDQRAAPLVVATEPEPALAERRWPARGRVGARSRRRRAAARSANVELRGIPTSRGIAIGRSIGSNPIDLDRPRLHARRATPRVRSADLIRMPCLGRARRELDDPARSGGRALRAGVRRRLPHAHPDPRGQGLRPGPRAR